MDLKDKVAVIAGGSGAIGAASARRLAQAGARIVVGYNSKSEQAGYRSGTTRIGPSSSADPDAGDAIDPRPRLRWSSSEYGRCDVLVNSAGFTRMIPHHDLEALTDELIDSIFAANVRGPFATIRAFAPLMKKAAGAVIVNISSIAAIVGTGSNIAYGGSKAALDTMALSLARILGPEIRVTDYFASRGGHHVRAGTDDGHGREGSLDNAAEARRASRRGGTGGDGRGGQSDLDHGVDHSRRWRQVGGLSSPPKSRSHRKRQNGRPLAHRARGWPSRKPLACYAFMIDGDEDE